MRGAALVCTGILLLAGCGRSRMAGRDSGVPARGPAAATDAHDGASDPRSDPAGPASPDRAIESRPELPPRDAGLGDVAGGDVMPDAAAMPELLPRDARPADGKREGVGRDAFAAHDLPATGCAPLANDGVLNLGHIKQARFAPDGRSLLVRIGVADTDTTDDARLIRLPDGDSRVLGSGVRNVEWLGPTAVLLSTADQLLAVSLDGEVLLTVPGPTCGHAVVPDGSRFYYVSACGSVSRTLHVVDLATGRAKRLATNAAPGSPTVSPDGRWAAYVGYSGEPASGSRVAHVADPTGATYAIAGLTSVSRIAFVSGDMLLVEAQGSRPLESTIWRHDLGTENSWSLGEGDIGIAGYEISGDGSSFLMGRFPDAVGMTGELLRVPVDGSEPVRLATDLMDYRMYSMAIRVFAFASPSRRILYLADNSSDAGRSYGVVSASSDGSQREQLSADTREAVVSSFADRVALIDVDRNLGRGNIHVVSASGASQFTVEVAGDVSFASFVPHDRGLLFVQMTASRSMGSTSELRHLSFVTGKVTMLTWWSKTTLALSRYPLGLSIDEYPVDSNGCYIVVDSDQEQTASRLVALPD